MIEILCGMIGSGKSTYTKAMATSGALVVNDDSIVNAIHGGYNYLYNQRHKYLYKQIENSIIYYGVNEKLTVIIDRPNLKVDTRKRYIGIAKSMDVGVRAIIFPILGKEIHVNRRIQSDARGLSKEEWEKVYDNHLSIYEPPSISEGFDEIIYYEDIYKI